MTIRLVPLTAEAGERLERAPEECAREIGASFGSSGELVRELAAQSGRLPAAASSGVFRGGYLAVDEELREVVGTCAFKTPPSAQGEVEIADFTFPGHAGRGVGTAMAVELLVLAGAAPEVNRVVAHTLLEPGPSTRILEKPGFAIAGDAADPEVGRVRRLRCSGCAGTWLETSSRPPSGGREDCETTGDSARAAASLTHTCRSAVTLGRLD